YSFLLSCSSNRRALSIRAAMFLAASACFLGCSGRDIATAAPPPRQAPVFTGVVITTYNGNTSPHVGDTLAIFVQAVDQYGKSISVDSSSLVLSDATIASIVYAPADPWDYGDGPCIVGAKPGMIVVTATATVGGFSRSSTQSITILAADASS
ncbi:MAG: hypothetical protein M3Y30_03100, partial [Gemmatimonadota bacterium]|nr:hypothetical protein [Gemmatimonadota bacterium]